MDSAKIFEGAAAAVRASAGVRLVQLADLVAEDLAVYAETAAAFVPALAAETPLSVYRQALGLVLSLKGLQQVPDVWGESLAARLPVRGGTGSGHAPGG